jgi:ribosome-associated protein
MNEDHDYEFEDDEVEYYAVRPNKTQIKRDIAVLFALGEEMSQLSPAQLESLELPDIIHKAVTEVSGMPLKGARKRLLKYIAAQLHKIDVEPILENLARIKNKSAHAVREHHIAERWRDRLITEGDNALTELLDEHPEADRQQIRQLVRNAQKEAETAKPPKSSRMLYRYVKELLMGTDETDYEDDGLPESIIDDDSEE